MAILLNLILGNFSTRRNRGRFLHLFWPVLFCMCLYFSCYKLNEYLVEKEMCLEILGTFQEYELLWQMSICQDETKYLYRCFI